MLRTLWSAPNGLLRRSILRTKPPHRPSSRIQFQHSATYCSHCKQFKQKMAAKCSNTLTLRQHGASA